MVLALALESLTTSEIARRCGIPRSTGDVSRRWVHLDPCSRLVSPARGSRFRLPGIVAECAAAMSAITPGRVRVAPRSGERSVEVSNYWKHWPCRFPQHGPGKKHLRAIALRSWQDAIVSSCGQQFIRGLIHSDGTRIVATERKGSYVRRAPRYVFSNRSEDILGLFTAACDCLGVHWTRSSEKQVSIYSKAAVARLDEFVGPKQ